MADILAQQQIGHVTLVARDASRLEACLLERKSKWSGTSWQGLAADAATPAGAQQLSSCVAASTRPIDLLINAVGQSDRGLIMKLTTERLEELMRVNLLAPLLSAQAVVPSMVRGGVIVNLGSLSSYFAPRFLGGYSIAKHGLRAMSQQMRMELADAGIHVMLACPGPIARADAGSRYNHLAGASDLPGAALRGGGGARLKGLDAERLARDILSAAASRQYELIRPRRARLLVCLMALSPRLGQWLLGRMTSSAS